MPASAPGKAAAPQLPASPASPSDIEARALPKTQAVVVHSSQAAFGLDFVTALGVDLNALPADLRRLCLAPGTIPEDGVVVVPVGRSHQQRAFEAWVPDQRQNCISRTAFEVMCGLKGEKASLAVRGSGLISVDGKAAPRDTGMPLSSGVEIAFHHGADMSAVLLRLRFVTGAEISQEKEPEKVEKKAAEPSSPCEEPSSPVPPRRAVRAFEDLEVRSPSARSRSACPGAWILACVHVEGLTAGQLADLPSVVRDIQVPGPLMLGRIHQNQFESLAKAAEKPKLGNFISRTHGQLDTDSDGLSLCVTNLSSNPQLGSCVRSRLLIAVGFLSVWFSEEPIVSSS